MKEILEKKDYKNGIQIVNKLGCIKKKEKE